MGQVGLLWRPGAGACPNLPQRRSGPGSAAKKSAEYQRFFSRAPARSGPLWQIWTNCRRRPGGEGGCPPRRGPRRRRRRGYRRGGRSRTGRTPRSTAPAPPERRPTRAQAPRPARTGVNHWERGFNPRPHGPTPVLMGRGGRAPGPSRPAPRPHTPTPNDPHHTTHSDASGITFREGYSGCV